MQNKTKTQPRRKYHIASPEKARVGVTNMESCIRGVTRILDRSCQIHDTPERPANHTNRDCWVFKQAGKSIAEHKDKGLDSDDEQEPRPPNNKGQKGFPPEVRMVHMIYATHIPKRERKRVLRDV